MPDRTKTVREIYAALNRNDIPAVFQFFDPEIERTEHFGAPTDATHRGYAAVKVHFLQGRGNWAEGSCEPENIIVSGDKVLVNVYVRVRLKNKVEWNEGRVADVFTFRGEKITEFHSFTNRDEALNWAGVKESNTL